MRITIHQPEHLPWLGFFHKVAQADIFVVLDNVQFRKNYFQNRNKIRTPQGWQWVTVPVRHSLETLIKDVQIAPDVRWQKKWLGSIYSSYKKSPYFDLCYPGIQEVANKNWARLCYLNNALIQLFCQLLGIKATVVSASQMGVQGSASELILRICTSLKAKTYISGISGREYLKLNDFAQEHIEVVFQEFHHPIYTQRYKPFIPRMSVIDLVCNHGEKSLNIINGIDTQVMEEVFL